MIVAIYVGLVAILSLHGAHRVLLTGIAWLRRPSPPPPPLTETPLVVVQLPLYNERDVVGRLIDATAALDWPNLRIQVLDDSTDDTLACADAAILRARARGIPVEVHHRDDRTGFKAGALAAGMAATAGEFFAIFDADFVPPPDFLRRVMPAMGDPNIGMVQARWGHLNDQRSALTGAQAMLLDGHFAIEHTARATAGLWTHFNGTAGVWRRRCIDDGGGWQHDTLTEDLDLSYRAQLKGWRFAYRLDVTVPAELPESFAALRTQQRRWAKGSIQTFRKLLFPVLTAPAPLRKRAEALMHLSANLIWPLALLLAVLMPAVILLRPEQRTLGHLALELPAFCFSLAANVLYYGLSQDQLRTLARLPLVMLLGVGLSLNQTFAVIEALRGPPGTFERTPKNGGQAGSYPSFSRAPIAGELLLAAWHLSVAVWAVGAERWGAIPFLLLFGLGFGWVGLGSWWERQAQSPAIRTFMENYRGL